MLKIAVVGPESSGKTTLSAALAQRLGTSWVREHARTFLEDLGRPYREEDLIDIARGQVDLEDRLGVAAKGPLICDTDMITLRIWSEEKFGRCDPRIVEWSEGRPYDHWLLCRPDIPWEPDPLRENPRDRDRLFEVYEAMLKKLGRPYSIMEGDPEQRMRTAMATIGRLLQRKV